MSCLECGSRTVKNGRESTKMRGVFQNFCAGVVAGSILGYQSVKFVYSANSTFSRFLNALSPVRNSMPPSFATAYPRQSA